MNEKDGKTIEQIFAEGTLIDKALADATQKALWEHKQVGNPVAAWRDGKVIWITPEEISIEKNIP